MDDERLDPFTLAVLDYARDEREREKVRRGLLDLIKRHPFAAFRTLLDTIAPNTRFQRRRLLRVFGYDVRRKRWLRGRRESLTIRDEWRFWQANRDWEKESLLQGALLLGALSAHERGENPYEGGVREFVYADRMRVWPHGCDVVLAPWPDVRAESLACFTGTLLARISLSRNHRLRAVLTPGSHHEQMMELAGRLPGAVFSALHAGGPHEHPQTVLNRAVRYLEYEGHPRRSYRPRKCKLDGEPAPWPEAPWRQKYDPLPLIVKWMVEGQDDYITDRALRESGLGSLDEHLKRLTGEKLKSICESLGIPIREDLFLPPIEEFTAREEAAAIPWDYDLDYEALDAATELAKRHDLTERQTEVFALKSAGLTHEEIAAVLNIAAGTSKALMHKATQKVKGAA